MLLPWQRLGESSVQLQEERRFVARLVERELFVELLFPKPAELLDSVFADIHTFEGTHLSDVSVDRRTCRLTQHLQPQVELVDAC